MNTISYDTDGKIKGFLPKILVLYFPVQYIFAVVSFQYGLSLELINILVFTIGLFYVILKLKKDEYLFTFFIYCCLLTAVLCFTTFFAQNPGYSFIRVMITCWLLFSSTIVFYYVFKQTEGKMNWNNAVTKSVFAILIIAAVGQMTIGSWSEIYGLRLTGGINPNGMAWIVLFSNFWFFYQSINKGFWNRLNKWGWILSFVLLIGTMSRSVIVSLFILYGFYTLCLVVKGLWRLTPKRLFISLFIVALILPLYNYIKGTLWYQINIERLLSSENLSNRESAWSLMLDIFNDNIWVGGAGWWNATNIIQSSNVMSDYPHSLYLRLLSETGILGFSIVLIFPSILILTLLFVAMTKNITNKKQIFFVASMLLGLFVGMAFEDRYLTGYGGFDSGAVVWVMAMGMVSLEKRHQLKEHSQQETKKTKKERGIDLLGNTQLEQTVE